MNNIQNVQKDVGASKAAKGILGSLDRRLQDPAGSVIRVWGFVFLLFVTYLLLVGSFDSELYKVIAWLIGYSAYLCILELSRAIATRKYDSTLFRSLRVFINLVVMSILISFSSEDVRPILVFAYMVPIFASIVYFSKYNWIWLVTVVMAITGLYLSGIILTDHALDLMQFSWMCFSLLGLSYTSNWFYRRTVYKSNIRVDDTILGLPRSLDLQELMSATVQIAIKLTQANRGLLIVINPRNKRYVAHESKGFTLRQGQSIEDVAQGCLGLFSGQPFECPDMIKVFNNKSIYHKYFNEQSHSVLAQPLFDSAGQVLGILNVAYDAVNRFDRISQNELQEFAFLVSSKIENCFAYRELKLREARGREASEKFVSVSSEDEAIQTLVGEVCAQIPHAEGVTLHKYRIEDKGLLPVGRKSFENNQDSLSWSDSMPARQEPHMHLGHGIAGHALELLDTISVHDIDHHPWYIKLEGYQNIRSLLVAPLYDPKSRDLYGTLSLASNKLSAFNLDDETILAHLTTHTSLAIAKFREFQDYVERGGKLRKILEKIRLFDIKSSETELCLQITDAAVSLLGFQIARLRILNEDQLVTIAVSGVSKRTKGRLIGTKLPYNELKPFLSPEFRVENSYLIKHGTTGWQQFADKYFSKTQSSMHKKSGWRLYDALLTPFLDQSGNVVGLLTLDVPITGSPPDQKGLESIDIFANAASWIIELARFQRRLIEQRHRAQSFINTISHELAKCRDLPTICEVVVQVGAKLLSAEGCSLYLVHGNEIELTSSNYLANTDYITRRKPISRHPKSGLTAWVAATGEILYFNNEEYKDHEAWAEETDQLQFFPGKRCLSVLLAPVKDAEDKVMGVISLENKITLTGSKDFDEEDVERLKGLADEFARALQAIGLYDDIKEWERTGLAEDIHDLINWHHSGIISWVEAIEEWLKRNDYQKVKELTPQLRQHAFTFVQELKTLHINFLAKSLEAPTFRQALEETLSAWTKHVTPKYEKEKMRISFNCPENLEIPIKIRNTIIRFASLAFSNAIHHSGIAENPEIEVRVNVEQKDQMITLAVVDNGRGIDYEKNLPGFGFDRMRQLAGKINYWGEMQAEFQIQTEVNKGTKVNLTLRAKTAKGTT